MIGVSLKMYFSLAESRAWMASAAAAVRDCSAIDAGELTFFVAPSFLAIPSALTIFDGTRGLVAAQDASAEDRGPFTGEVGAFELAGAGVAMVEVGHAERRLRFGESEHEVASKVSRIRDHGLVPIVCVGEPEVTAPDDAATEVIRQLQSAISLVDTGPLVVAYEPIWAIGAAAPASALHVTKVCRILREYLDGTPCGATVSLLYGGSAGPSMLTALPETVDGLFLGRFVHDPQALALTLRQANDLANARRGRSAAAHAGRRREDPRECV